MTNSMYVEEANKSQSRRGGYSDMHFADSMEMDNDDLFIAEENSHFSAVN